MDEIELKLWSEIDAAISRAEDAGLDNKRVLGLMVGYTSRVIGVCFSTKQDLEAGLPVLTGALAKEARDYFDSRQPR